MFKILVADDERFIRQGIISILIKNIDEELNCIEAANGIEALEKANLEKPNLIITDICMPGCDGLEFISKLKEQNTNTPVIILSGYENFDYAKRAIKLGVKEYVMKPIKKVEFIELIQSYIRHIREQRQKDNEEAIRMIENTKIMEKLKRDFLVGLLNCKGEEQAEEYLMQLANIGMRFESKYYMCAVTEYKITEDTKEYIDFAVKNVLDEYLSMESEEFLTNVLYHDGILVSIFETDRKGERKESKKRIMVKAVHAVKEYCKVPCYAGLGETTYDSVHLYKAISHAMLAANFKILERGESVCVYEECAKPNQREFGEIAAEIRKAGGLDSYKILDLFQKTYLACRKENDIYMLSQEYEEVTEYLLRRCGKQGVQQWNKLPEQFASFFSIIDLKKALRELIQHAVANRQEEEGSISNTALMEQILQYMEEHITEEIDLITVATRFKRTPGYISTLFKKHVKGGFNNYINTERVEIAKKLLKDYSLSIQEISELTGYSNSKYFSVVFKKITGLTPRNYREQK